MDERRFFPAICLQFSFGCTLCTLVYLMSLTNGEVGRFFPLVLVPYAPGIFVINWQFLKGERTMREVVLLNVCLGMGFFAAIFRIDGWNGIALAAFAGFFLLWITVRGVNSAMRRPGLHSQILVLDTSALLLVSFTGFLAIMDLPSYWGIPITVGFAAAVLGVITMRMNRVIGMREWIFIGLAFVLMVILGWGLMTTVAAPAGQGLVAVWNGAMAVVRMIGRTLWAFLLFIASLMKPADYGEEVPFEPFEIPEVKETLVEANPMVAVVMAVLGIVLLVGFALWGLYLLGKLRVGGSRGEKERKGPARRRFSFLKALRRLFRQWTDSIRRYVFLWKNRDTPLGLYYILVHKCRFGLWHKRAGETPREFLSRLVEYARGDSQLEEALVCLIPAVDVALYAPRGRAVGKIPAARLIRKKINAVARRQYIKGRFANLKMAIKRDVLPETI